MMGGWILALILGLILGICLGLIFIEGVGNDR